MEILEPSVKLIDKLNLEEHVAYCAATCYNSKPKEGKAAHTFCDALWKSNHRSVFRHWSHYYIMPKSDDYIQSILRLYANNPYVQWDQDMDFFYAVVNDQFYKENPEWIKETNWYEVYKRDFYERCPELYRYTFELVTSIGVSRELNRVSPNNITERSTRYVESSEICKPCWMKTTDRDLNFDEGRFLNACDEAFKNYNSLLLRGFPKERARDVLPLATATKVIYTYSVKEWRNIIDLRYYGTTGRPHPDARFIIGMVRDFLINEGYKFND